MRDAVSREPDLDTNEEPVGLFQASYMIGLVRGQGCKVQQCTVLAHMKDDAPAEARGMPELLQLGLMHDAPARGRPGGVRG